MLIRKLDENLWVIRSSGAEAYIACCYESKQAALCALDLPAEDRMEMQRHVGDGVITYREVARAVASRRRFGAKRK